MTIERELLKRFMTELKTEEDVVSLFNDIKECLAQPEQEQEPVAWIATGIGGGTAVGWYEKDIVNLPKGTKLYLHPPKQPESTAEAVMPNGVFVSNVYDAYEEGRKSVMVKQEPVAWMWTRNYEGGGYTNKVFEFLNDAEEYAKDSKTLKSPDIICPLYTTPPTRKFLSVKQAKDLWETTFKSAVPYYTFYEICVAIEKAHGIGGEI